LVAVVAIRFWGVGSIISKVCVGDVLEKGDYFGHFGYGGSSILLAFEPKQNIKLLDVQCPDNPTLIEVRQG